ncbi:MAG TPA: alpha/beta hydrolase [Candidatus Dormibacteraeota bacterium]|jgi:pimeloyl-ACP methyl ester carboxylesterase
MPLEQINGQWINYEDTGGNLGPIVLAHGILMDREMFAPQIEAAKAGTRFITWDARCHGDTENTVDPFSYWDLADDLKGLLDHLGIERAVIGGMSQGGFVALRFALRYPERVSALVLLGTQAGVEDPEKVATYEVMLDVWESEGLNDQLAETIAAIILGNEWPGRAPWIAKWRQMPRSLLRQAFQTLVSRDDIQNRLGEIKAPALVIHGTADAAIDIEKAHRVCSDLADCEQFVAVEGGGHAVNLTHPKVVNLAIQQFLGELDLRPRRSETLANARRVDVERRSGERRNSKSAGPGHDAVVPVDRRTAERRSR